MRVKEPEFLRSFLPRHLDTRLVATLLQGEPAVALVVLLMTQILLATRVSWCQVFLRMEAVVPLQFETRALEENLLHVF
jgi:hypothetical protein